MQDEYLTDEQVKEQISKISPGPGDIIVFRLGSIWSAHRIKCIEAKLIQLVYDTRCAGAIILAEGETIESLSDHVFKKRIEALNG